MGRTAGPSGAVVRLLDHDADLGRGLDPRTFATARRAITADTIVIERGAALTSASKSPVAGEVGALVLEGVLTRTVTA